MNKKRGIGIETTVLIILLFVLVIVVSLAVYLIISYRTGIVKQSEDISLTSTIEYVTEVNSKIESALQKTAEISSALSPMLTEDEVLRYFYALEQSEASDMTFLRFYLKGRIYDSGGREIDLSSPSNRKQTERLAALVSGGKPGCSGLIYDNNNFTSMAYLAFYSPVKNNSLIDGIVTYFMVEEMFGKMVSFTPNMAVNSEYLAMCAADGTIILEVKSGRFPTGSLTNVYDRMQDVTNDKSISDDIRRAVASDGVGSRSFMLDGKNYSCAVVASEPSGNTLFVLNVYNASKLFSEGYDFIESLTVILIIYVLLMTAGVLYMRRVRSSNLEKIKSLDNVNPLLECNTFKKFSIDTEEILQKNKITKFACVYTEVDQYRFITESYENIKADEVLRFIAKVFKMNMLQDETYGHISEDKFTLLIHYSDENDLMNRLRVIYAIVFNYPELKRLHTNLRLSMGVYCLDRMVQEPIQKMLDRAIIAQKTNMQNTAEAINIYNEKVKNNYIREAEIEARKESALADGEFRVFYQPKYNIAQNRPDGAEALVRWYDAETNTFRNPAEFVPIFEANGFIGKVDRYVYVEVCKYIAESVERGLKIVPVSVNVSRVTATQEGFVDFYVRTKRKYKIADNFLTVEFTESFAFENYEVLKDIIRSLKSNGILCSIDDFGSGYSSYNILKELQMDELKLDRFFITRGFSEERDDKLLKTIISLAKDFGMKVTQEGVETVDALEKLERFGCDVIQGYYYSKPLVLDDYIAFLSGGGAIQRF